MNDLRTDSTAPVALVTGASRGIGAATALRLAQDGFRVGLVGRNQESLNQVEVEIRARGGVAAALPADLADRDDVAGLIDRLHQAFGRLDVLVNNAGILPAARLTNELTFDDFAYVQTVNLVSPWFLACRAHDLMTEVGGGVVVNVTSTAAYYPAIGLSHYNTSKAALTMLTRALALEWARDAVRVVGVAPGRVDTDMVKPIIDYDIHKGRQPNPLNRLGSPDEIASLIAYLVSDRASYITGSFVTIDGGEMLAAPSL